MAIWLFVMNEDGMCFQYLASWQSSSSCFLRLLLLLLLLLFSLIRCFKNDFKSGTTEHFLNDFYGFLNIFQVKESFLSFFYFIAFPFSFFLASRCVCFLFGHKNFPRNFLSLLTYNFVADEFFMKRFIEVMLVCWKTSKCYVGWLSDSFYNFFSILQSKIFKVPYWKRLSTFIPLGQHLEPSLNEHHK